MDTSTLVHPSLFQSNTVTLILLSFSFSYHTPHQPVNISQKYLSIKRRQKKKKRTMKIQESVFHFVYFFTFSFDSTRTFTKSFSSQFVISVLLGEVFGHSIKIAFIIGSFNLFLNVFCWENR